MKKVDLYILSLSILFLFIAILTFKIPNGGITFTFKSITSLLSINIIPSVCLLLLAYSVFAYLRFSHHLKGTTQIPFTVTKIESINYEHLTFLATYVIPLISFDFADPRQCIIFFMLLIIMGIIYIKTDLFYANPALALLGFHIYKADCDFKNGVREGVIIISRNRVNKNSMHAYISLDERIYYTKGN